MARRLRQLTGIRVDRLEGVGAKKAAALAEVGVETVFDLLTYYPRRYVDRTNQVSIASIAVGEDVLVLGSVRRSQSKRTRQGRTMVEVDITDGTGYLKLTFFNQPWRAKQLSAGTEVAVFGRVDVFRGNRQMTNPVVDLVGTRTGKIVPLYPQSEKAGLTSWEVADWMAEALERAGEFEDPLPRHWRESLELAGRTWAMRMIHAPESMGAAQMARRRLAFDELLRLQLVLVMRKRAVERSSVGIAHVVSGPLLERFFASLPFPLTAAQERVIAEIAADMASPLPMHRLLQGDVGAGKTMVAVATMLMAAQGGHQAALMAPTEVLAEQHFYGVRDLLAHAELHVEDRSGSLFSQRPVSVALLTNRTTARERAELAAGLLEQRVDIVIGTHALIAEGVAFADLAAVVIDEQHRFGVEQRAALREKATGHDPDVLVMTATPIPRTAAMTVYGDLDTSVLDELPPGRTPVETHWARTDLEAAQAYAHIRSEVEAGRQAFVVCPLVEESERVAARSAVETYEALAHDELKELNVGLLHGQMPSKEKEAVMSEFRMRGIDVLVATTVIEVGVDVPNATIMLIQNADRFGIAQLHQLRGRVGRGQHRSYCYLLGETTTAEGAARLEAVERSTDGFELAEVDLELRGEGTILGTRQKGRTDLKLASLRRDKALVAQAREVAIAIVDADPHLDAHAELHDEIRLFVDPAEEEFLFKS